VTAKKRYSFAWNLMGPTPLLKDIGGRPLPQNFVLMLTKSGPIMIRQLSIWEAGLGVVGWE